MHEIEFSESTVTMLGWADRREGVLRPTYKRIWRIRIAIRELLSRGRMTGQQLEPLIGHMTFVSLCRREALACLVRYTPSSDGITLNACLSGKQ